MLEKSLIAVLLLAGLVALVAPNHVAASRATYGQSPEALWEVITDHASAPQWRRDIERVERAPDRDGHAVWIERTRFGPMPLEVTLAEPPRRYVTRIAGEDLPFGGTWTFEIEPTVGGSTLTITEKGVVKAPLFRVVARFVFGYHGTMDDYLEALGERFGEEVEPVHVGS